MSELQSGEGDVTTRDREAVVRRAREDAAAARSRGDHEAALAHFRAALAVDPDHLWSLQDAAGELLELGRLDEAEAGFRALRDRDANFVHARFGLAQVARRRGDHAVAIDLLHAALAVDPGHLWSLHTLAAELRDLGRFDEAEALLERALALAPRFYPARIGLGLIARRRGDHLRALEHYRAVLTIEPDHLWSIQDAATELLELGRLDEAEATAREALARDPTFVHAWFGLGQIARRRGDHATAAEHFRAAVGADPRHLWSLHALAAELRDLDRFDEAEATLERALAVDPRFFSARIGLGQVARRRGDHAAALEQYRAVLAIDPDHLWSREDVAIELFELGRLEEAEAAHREVLARDGRFAAAWYGLGRTLRRRGDPSGALASFREALALDPHHLWAMQEQAAVLCDLDRRGEAGDLLRGWIATHPDVAAARHSLAEIERIDAAADAAVDVAVDAAVDANDAACAVAAGDGDDAPARADDPGPADPDGEADPLDLVAVVTAEPDPSDRETIERARERVAHGRADEAAALLGAAVARTPDRPALWLELGHGARAIGDHVAAAADYAEVAERFPGHVPAAIALAQADVDGGRLDLAITRLVDVLIAAPGEAAAIELLGRIAELLDDPTTAILHYRRAVELDPEPIRHHLEAARCLTRIGRVDDALAALRRLRDQRPPAPEIDIVEALILAECGRLAEERAVLDAAAERFPAHFEIRVARIAALVAHGDIDAAERAVDEMAADDARRAARLSFLRGQIAAARWRPEAALAHFRAGLAFDPNDARINDGAARAALLCVDPDAAAIHLERSIADGGADRSQRGASRRRSRAHLHRLLDDHRRDRDVVAELRACAGAADPVAAHAGLVAAFPDSTPAAIGLLMALRRAGRLDAAGRAAKRAGPPPIPTRIGQFWDEGIPDDVEAYCRTWAAFNPAYAHRRFSKVEARRFLEETGAPRVLAAFDRAGTPAGKAELFRLAYLWQEGGWWADADDRCLAPLSTLDPGDTDLLLHQEDLGMVGDTFIGARPHHPVIGRALAAALAAFERGEPDTSRPAAGPGLLTRALAGHLAADIGHRPAEVTILDRTMLHRAVATHCRASYKHTGSHWSRSAFAAVTEAERGLFAARARWHDAMLGFLAPTRPA